MIKNVPSYFTQNDLIYVINQQFYGRYDYFYMPVDINSKFNMGFAFINMVSPIYILDFYLDFNCCQWKNKVENCNSQKYCEIVYANM